LERAYITTKKQGKKWYEVKSSLAGDIQFVAFVNIHDVIEKDNKLERLNENKNQILSILGHDLKAPLQNLAKLIQLLIEDDLSAEEFKNNLVTVQRLSKDTLQFIDTTLTWTRSNFEDHKPTLQKFSPYELVCSIVALYNREFEYKKILPLINVPPEVSIFSDREIIHIALRNIISNAIKFSPVQTPIIIAYHEKENNDCLTVTDQGEGIPPEIIDRILKNQTNKASGSGFGIGLRLCKEVLQHVNGELKIKSTSGKGTSFTVLVPKASD
jgi:signal transduction histidine kinase